MMYTYNKHNFHKNTFCIFKQVSFTEIENLRVNYKSSSGSSYYFTEQGVYRVSNHWGRAANCRWRLISNSDYKNQLNVCGYANWNDFLPNNDIEKLFYIDIDWVNNQPLFFHKLDKNYNGQLLRNANETSKRIQKINEVLLGKQWEKYCDVFDLDTAKQMIIDELILTNDTLFQIIQRVNGKT